MTSTFTSPAPGEHQTGSRNLEAAQEAAVLGYICSWGNQFDLTAVVVCSGGVDDLRTGQRTVCKGIGLHFKGEITTGMGTAICSGDGLVDFLLQLSHISKTGVGIELDVDGGAGSVHHGYHIFTIRDRGSLAEGKAHIGSLVLVGGGDTQLFAADFCLYLTNACLDWCNLDENLAASRLGAVQLSIGSRGSQHKVAV